MEGLPEPRLPGRWQPDFKGPSGQCNWRAASQGLTTHLLGLSYLGVVKVVFILYNNLASSCPPRMPR